MAAIRFEVVASCPYTGARAGRLITPHAEIPTPAFMPVGTQGTVKGLTHKQLLEELDVRLILANTYHLYLRPGLDVIRKFNGLRTFMSWPAAILTDSGGYQVFSLAPLRRVVEDGVWFRSHIDGSEHFFTPENTVDIQLALGSDILMVLDECLEYPVSYERAKASVELTLKWARRAFDHFRRKGHHLQDEHGLFAIVQGSTFADLREYCTRSLLELEAPGYAIGGLSVGEPRQQTYTIVELVTNLLPKDRPRYLMGVGLPLEMVEYVARGIDMMDCVLPTRNARNGCLFTSQGRLQIKNACYRDDPAPIDENCSCYTCRTFSRAYLRHLYQSGELLYSVLATVHNVAFYMNLMRAVREKILVGEFYDYLNQLRQRWSPTSEVPLQS